MGVRMGGWASRNHTKKLGWAVGLTREDNEWANIARSPHPLPDHAPGYQPNSIAHRSRQQPAPSPPPPSLAPFPLSRYPPLNKIPPTIERALEPAPYNKSKMEFKIMSKMVSKLVRNPCIWFHPNSGALKSVPQKVYKMASKMIFKIIRNSQYFQIFLDF